MPPVQPSASWPSPMGGKVREWVHSTLDRSRMTIQTSGSSSRSTPEVKSPVSPEEVLVASHDSEDSVPNDPMASALIHPFVIPVTVRNLRTSLAVCHGALIDSGCTCCLICRAIVNRLGLGPVSLRTPIRFEQMDGSLLGGAPVTQVTETVRLEIGEHRESIQFIVVERMIELIILGLPRLDKWKPNIWWEDGFRKLRLAVGPDLGPDEQARQIRQESNGGEGFPETWLNTLAKYV